MYRLDESAASSHRGEEDFWKAKVSKLMNEKKNFAQMLKKKNSEIREVSQINQLLESSMRKKDNLIDQLKLEKIT